MPESRTQLQVAIPNALSGVLHVSGRDVENDSLLDNGIEIIGRRKVGTEGQVILQGDRNGIIAIVAELMFHWEQRPYLDPDLRAECAACKRLALRIAAAHKIHREDLPAYVDGIALPLRAIGYEV